jgi:peptidoglycan/LPS O-acetylase OafA/YrhL
MKTKPGPPYVHGRILNRHLRGRPRFGCLERLKSRAKRLIPILFISSLLAIVAYIAHSLGLI